jgi:hypothetical protein
VAQGSSSSTSTWQAGPTPSNHGLLGAAPSRVPRDRSPHVEDVAVQMLDGGFVILHLEGQDIAAGHDAG